MKVTWKVDDGFMGNGEHTTIIDDSYFEDMNEEEKQMEIEEWVSNDFHTMISYNITHINNKKV